MRIPESAGADDNRNGGYTDMIRLVLVFVIVAVGCVAVGLIVTKIIKAIMAIKTDFEKEERK